jgi:hypothetical protein
VKREVSNGGGNELLRQRIARLEAMTKRLERQAADLVALVALLEELQPRPSPELRVVERPKSGH